jgi:hypothetical protein
MVPAGDDRSSLSGAAESHAAATRDTVTAATISLVLTGGNGT